MPQIYCPNCKQQFVAVSPGSFVTQAMFAIAGALICRLWFGHLIVDGIDVDLSKPPIDPRFAPSRWEFAATELAGVIGWWGVIGGLIGLFIGVAFDHFSRSCPKCGHKQ